MLIIAHRGASGCELENTKESLQKAIEMKVDMVEFDVSVTKDGVPVLFHDNRLFRLSRKVFRLRKLEFKDIKNYILKKKINGAIHKSSIITFEDALSILSNIKINVELKPSSLGHEKKILEILSEKGLKHKSIISSFDFEIIKNIKKIDSEVKIGYLASYYWKKKLDKISSIGGYSINPHYMFITKKNVEEAHKQGLKVYAYPSNTIKSMRNLIEANVDGIITNYPDKLRGLLDEMHKSSN